MRYFGNVAAWRAAQPWKAAGPIVVIESGRVILTREVQPWNAFSWMTVTELGSVIFAREVQPSKALSWMVVTESGMTRAVTSSRKANSSALTTVTPNATKASVPLLAHVDAWPVAGADPSL